MNQDKYITDMQQCLQNMELIGDVWILAVVMVLEHEGLGFNRLRQTIPNINPATLNNRLKKMLQAGIIDRRASPYHKQAVIYNLTPRGRLLLPIIHEMKIAAIKLSE